MRTPGVEVDTICIGVPAAWEFVAASRHEMEIRRLNIYIFECRKSTRGQKRAREWEDTQRIDQRRRQMPYNEFLYERKRFPSAVERRNYFYRHSGSSIRNPVPRSTGLDEILNRINPKDRAMPNDLEAAALRLSLALSSLPRGREARNFGATLRERDNNK